MKYATIVLALAATVNAQDDKATASGPSTTSFRSSNSTMSTTNSTMSTSTTASSSAFPQCDLQIDCNQVLGVTDASCYIFLPDE